MDAMRTRVRQWIVVLLFQTAVANREVMVEGEVVAARAG